MLGHEERRVGTVNLLVGQIGEPFLQGPRFGFEVQISSADRPVDGAQEVIRAEVQTNGAAEPLTLLEVGPGRYQALFNPTVEGRYGFRLVGRIGAQPIDETFVFHILPGTALGSGGSPPQPESVDIPSLLPLVLLGVATVALGFVLALRRPTTDRSTEPGPEPAHQDRT
jgi:hypothetical protein